MSGRALLMKLIRTIHSSLRRTAQQWMYTAILCDVVDYKTEVSSKQSDIRPALAVAS
jgi:hypothetical protein